MNKKTVSLLGMLIPIVFVACFICSTTLLKDENGFAFKRADYSAGESFHADSDMDKDGNYETLTVVYNNDPKAPLLMARFWRDDPTGDAYMLYIDFDRNGTFDVCIPDTDQDGYLDLDEAICYEHCESIEYKLNQIRKGLFVLEKSV